MKRSLIAPADGLESEKVVVIQHTWLKLKLTKEEHEQAKQLGNGDSITGMHEALRRAFAPKPEPKPLAQICAPFEGTHGKGEVL